MSFLDAISLEPGNGDSFIVEDIGKAGVSAFQCLRQPNGRYYAEILLDHGGPSEFEGNQILSISGLSVFQLLMHYAAVKIGKPEIVLFRYGNLTDRCKFWRGMGVV